MPNLDGRRRINAANSELGFNTHPADEEKRLAYTRGTLKKNLHAVLNLIPKPVVILKLPRWIFQILTIIEKTNVCV